MEKSACPLHVLCRTRRTSRQATFDFFRVVAQRAELKLDNKSSNEATESGVVIRRGLLPVLYARFHEQRCDREDDLLHR